MGCSYWAVACFDYIDPAINPNDPDIMHWGSAMPK